MPESRQHGVRRKTQCSLSSLIVWPNAAIYQRCSDLDVEVDTSRVCKVLPARVFSQSSATYRHTMPDWSNPLEMRNEAG